MNREILRLAIRNIISNISVPFLGIVDMALIGHMEAVHFIGALAEGTMILNFIYFGLGVSLDENFRLDCSGPNKKEKVFLCMMRNLSGGTSTKLKPIHVIGV